MLDGSKEALDGGGVWRRGGGRWKHGQEPVRDNAWENSPGKNCAQEAEDSE